MWIKHNFNQNTFTDFKFTNFTIFNQKYVLKIFGKVKIIKAPAGFELKTIRFVVNALTHCATLLADNFGGKHFLNYTLSFFSIGSTTSQYGVVPYHHNDIIKNIGK